MTAKDTTIEEILQSIEDEFTASGEEADLESVSAAIKKHATELRAALLAFDASAFVVVGWQYKNNWGDWVNGTESHCEIMQSVHGFKIRQIYAAQEAT